MKNSRLLMMLLVSLSVVLTACGGDDDDDAPRPEPTSTAEPVDDSTPTPAPVDDSTPTPAPVDDPTPAPEMATFEVKIINTTNNQPLSAPAVIMHDETYSAWTIGEPASQPLEILAESGSPADLIEAATDAVATAAGEGPIGPGASATMELTVPVEDVEQLTVVTMLVNTNDAITGIGNWDISGLAVDETAVVLTRVYDAGTEFNSELSETIPGPAGTGPGYDDERDDTADQVTGHPGVVTQADGYMESALNATHKFDNGAMKVKVTRTN